jgi:hypothetical protein
MKAPGVELAALVSLPLPGSHMPTITLPAISTAAKAARPTPIRAGRWRRCQASGGAAVPASTLAGHGRPARWGGRQPAPGDAGSPICELNVDSSTAPFPVLPLVSSAPPLVSSALPLVFSPAPSAPLACRGPCWYPVITAIAGAGR